MNEYANEVKKKLTFSDNDLARQLFGEHNGNLNKIANSLEISIHARGNTVHIKGDSISADLAENILQQLYGLLKEKYPVYSNDILRCLTWCASWA